MKRRTLDLNDLDQAAVARLIDRVESLRRGDDECWLWPWANSGEYATAKPRVRGARGYRDVRSVGVHRFVLAMSGPVGPDEEATHRCDVKLCVNPAHIERGTWSTNAREAYARGLVVAPRGTANGNGRKTHCPSGHAYSEENTYYYGPGRRRQCRTCRKARQQPRIQEKS